MKIAISIRRVPEDIMEESQSSVERTFDIPKSLSEDDARRAMVRAGTSVFTALEEFRRADLAVRLASIEVLGKEGFHA